jgi:hypothetical protein
VSGAAAPGWCWFARTSDQPTDAVAAASATDAEGATAGWLAAWTAGRKPVHDAVRMDCRLVDRDGPAAWVSLVLPPAGDQPIFDDPAVSGALRAVLAGPPADGISTFVRDSVHFAGAVTVRRDDPWTLRDDPFARLGPATILRVGAGLFGRTAPPPGPGTQRYRGLPWPLAGF